MNTKRRIWCCAALGVFFAGMAGERAALAAPTASAAALVEQAERELAAHPGRAVLDYERARLLAPRASQVREGLARARAAAGLPAEDAGLAPRVLHALSPDEWSRLALGALALAAVAVAGRRWWRRSTTPWAAAALGVALAAGAAAWHTAPRRTDGVVVGAGAVARIAPFDAAEPAFVAPEGAPVTVESTHQGYTRIRGDRGAGWVPSSAVDTILPRTS